jgi:signal transduction histidine kinase
MASLRRLTIAFLSMFGVATAATGYGLYTASFNARVTLVDRRIATAAAALLSEAPAGNPRAILARIASFTAKRENGDIGFELEDATGRRLGGNVVVTRPLPPGLTSLHLRDGIAGLTNGRAERRDAGAGLRLITVIETEPFDGFGAVRMRLYLLGFALVTLVVVSGMLSFSLLVRRRIADVRATAEAIIDGDLARRVPVDRHGGVFAGQARTFNRMLDRIADLVEGIREVGGNVAHDLRTPLARLRSRIAQIAATTPDPETEAALEETLAQCDAVLAMFAAILRIAEIEEGKRDAGITGFDLATIARDVGEALAPVAEESGHGLLTGPLPPTPATGDPALVTQAAINLIENALRHTPPGSSIRIDVLADATTASLRVADDGPGIAPADRALALRRFGRLDASRHRPGHGLGLPLVDAVARLHGGELALGDAAPGLVATLTLRRHR